MLDGASWQQQQALGAASHPPLVGEAEEGGAAAAATTEAGGLIAVEASLSAEAGPGWRGTHAHIPPA